MARVAKKDNEKLPAVRESASLAEVRETPSHDILGYLQFVASEIDEAIEVTRCDLAEKLEGDDASAKIKVVSDLRARHRKLTKYIAHEVNEVKTMIGALKATEDKAVIDALTSALRIFIETYEAKLKAFAQEFDVS